MSNISYIALYRKYRPQVFEEIVGQEHITKTLINQVKADKVAHAYLFSGPRGTGKTSAAKIFSRAVNCLNSIDGDPCNACEICKGISDGSIMDVIEIDAASNNSVDNVRDIRDEIIYTPSKAKYKVYIIDEVHMLSTGAFNALLKTLEEPPGHIIFILATTEPYKLPSTIISRCQRFDFKKISTKDISNKTKEIIKNLGVNVEDKAIELIARLSEGGMRDALSILDQAVSQGNEKITHQDILQMVGMVDNDIFFELSEALREKDATRSIEIINQVSCEGKDINNFIVRTLNHYRNLLMAKVLTKSDDIIDLSQEDIQKMKECANGYSKEEIMGTIEMLSSTLTDAKRSGYSKILLETAIIRMCNQTNQKIEYIEVKKDQTQKVQTEKKETPKQHKEEKKEEKKEPNSLNGIAKEVQESWGKILEDMRATGIMPLKIQCLNNVILKTLSESTILCSLEGKEGIHIQMVEDKGFIKALTDSILKVIGKEINVRFDLKKQGTQEPSKIDNFKEMVNKQGLGNLINEM